MTEQNVQSHSYYLKSILKGRIPLASHKFSSSFTAQKLVPFLEISTRRSSPAQSYLLSSESTHFALKKAILFFANQTDFVIKDLNFQASAWLNRRFVPKRHYWPLIRALILRHCRGKAPEKSGEYRQKVIKSRIYQRKGRRYA